MSFVGKTASVFGVFGLSALATLGIVGSAEAVSVNPGKDYFQTGLGASFTFGNGIGKVPFMGVPLDPITTGNADTIVERTQNCNFSGGSCMVNIEMIALSLKSINPVQMNEMSFDVIVSLDTSKESLGKLTLDHEFPDNNTDAAEGNASSTNFNVFFEAVFQEQGGNGSNDFSVFDSGTFNADGLWSHEPGMGSLVGPESSNFFWVGRVEHTAPGHRHPVEEPEECNPDCPPPDPVPEPLTILGSVTALGCGAFLKRQYAKKLNQKDVS